MAGVRQQFLDIEADSPPAIHLGGQGGAAPGAGGGGGGAMGSDAMGGSGGPGGDIHLHGAPGDAPGAGGGGAGAVGEGVVVGREEAAARSFPLHWGLMKSAQARGFTTSNFGSGKVGSAGRAWNRPPR
jgi:hypothetical protein